MEEPRQVDQGGTQIGLVTMGLRPMQYHRLPGLGPSKSLHWGPRSFGHSYCCTDVGGKAGAHELGA